MESIISEKDSISAYKQKRYQYVFDYFSEQILSGKLKLDDKIPPERDIAEQLGVSRNTVREVIHMLEINGLVECVQGSGNYIRCNPQEYMTKSANMVTALLEIEYSEIFFIRRGYECTAFDLAVDSITDEELTKMHQILKLMDQTSDSKEGARLDILFHNLLLEASHNRLLILYASMLQGLMKQFVEDYRTRILMEERYADVLSRSHWNIYYALKDRDLTSGRAALERHFEVVQEHLKL